MMMTEKQMKQRQAQARRAAKRRRVMRNRMILAAIVIALVSAITIGIVSHVNKANAAVNETVYIPDHTGIYMTYSHTVKGGESLGTIAAKYIQQYGSDESVDTVVDRIIAKNGLDRTEATYHLQAGQTLSVSLWIGEDRNPHHSDTNYNCLEESQN